MARGIRTVVRLSKSQTKEFLASLSNPKNERNSRKAINKALRTKFNVIL